MRGIILRAAALLFGLVSWAGLVVTVVAQGALFKRPSKKEKEGLAIAQKKFWELGNAPYGLKHEFAELRNGLRLHYVVNARVGEPKAKNLVIFIHGFPDSWVLWRQLLTSSSLAQNAVLVGVDLPGFGGSDSIPSYSAEAMLEAITAFIIAMRELYLQKGGKVCTVGHDWGAVINVRLAAEAPQLADRFVIASAVLPEHVRSNAEAHIASSKQMLRTWIRRPLSFRLLKNALATLSPVLAQLKCSFYISIFNLPSFFANLTGSMGDKFILRAMHAVAVGRLLPDGTLTRPVDPTEAAESMASSSGPGEAQFAVSGPNGYPAAVKRRTGDFGWSEKIRVYRDGLFLSPWEKSLNTIITLSEIDQESPRRSSSGAGLFEDGPLGSLKAPATFVYGLKDPAFEPRLCLEGLSDYLVRKSQVVVLEKGGHWLPMEKQGQVVIERVVEWALREEGTLRGALEKMENLNFTVDK